MPRNDSLHLYEEIALLAIRDRKGTVITSYFAHVLAGAILAELMLGGRIELGEKKQKFVQVRDNRPTGDPIIDECLDRIATAKRRGSLQTWVQRLSGVKKLRHRAAWQLCDRGILRADHDKVALIFTRRIYPEIDPAPERRIVERLRAVVLGGDDRYNARTVALIALADASRLLAEALGRREVRAHKQRIKHIVENDKLGKATRDAISACETAARVAMIAATT